MRRHLARILSVAALAVAAAPSSAQCPLDELLASDGTFADRFGIAVAVSGDTALVGAPYHDTPFSAAGAAYVFDRSGTQWVQTAKLSASDAALGDLFGAAVSLDGDTALVGAWSDDSNRGSMYVFERSGGVWQQTAKLQASDGVDGDGFGIAVALSGDTAVAGAMFDDDGGSSSGSAYVFEKTGATWVQTRKLTASNAATEDEFGASVALVGDTAAVGAPHSRVCCVKGQTYVFERVGGVWSETAILTGAGAPDADQFGSGVAYDGAAIAVGAPAEDGVADYAGASYVFEKQAGVWVQTAHLAASDAAPSANFGSSVAVAGDHLLSGAGADQAQGVQSGAAYVFQRQGGVWIERSKLVASDGLPYDNAGSAVALSGDHALVGAPELSFSQFWGQGPGIAYAWSVSGAGCPPLYAAPDAISRLAGGTQHFTVQPGAALAGDFYLLAGTFSGTTPGFGLGGFTVPLNPDPYFFFTVAHPGQAPLAGSIGALSAAGGASASFTLGAGFSAALVGLTLHHAYAVFDGTTLTLKLVSNAEPLDLVP